MTNLEFRTGVIKPIEVYKETWEIMKGEFWTIFGIVIVAMVVAGVVPFVLVGPMMCGMYMCLLDKVDGQPAKFDKLFKGFDYFLPGLIVTLLVMVPMFIFIFLVYIPMIGTAIAGQRMDQTEFAAFLAGTLVFELLAAIVMILIHSLLLFAFPLMVDRKTGAVDSIKLSARAVWANMKGIAGLFGVGFLVVIAGYLVLCVGVYLALPIVIMANAVAYRKVFPAMDPMRFDPPSPSAYSGL